MYESTIELMYGAMRSEIEGAVYKAVQDVGIKVDKEELLCALMYDRQQYEKGFKDGMQAALEKIASTLTPRDPEICLLYAMQWEDDGCCMDCVECVKNYTGGEQNETA